MKSAWLRSVILASMLVLSGLALAGPQGYIPLQPGHTGNWYAPALVGEGMEVTVFQAEDGAPVAFGQVYLLADDGPRWLGFVIRTHDAWDGEQYEAVLYNRDEVNGEPISYGSLWIKPNAFGGIYWTLLVGDLGGGPAIREGMLAQLTRPVPGPVGHCGLWVFAPAPPPADPVFCHD